MLAREIRGGFGMRAREERRAGSQAAGLCAKAPLKPSVHHRIDDNPASRTDAICLTRVQACRQPAVCNFAGERHDLSILDHGTGFWMRTKD